MEIKISGKNRKMLFNIGFIRRLDELHSVKVDAVGIDLRFGAGLLTANSQLAQYSPVMLSDVVQAATDCTRAQGDKAVEDYADEHGSLDGLFKGIAEELKKSPVVKTTLEKMAELDVI